MSSLIKIIGKDEFLLSGNPSCPGCGLALGLRYALKALGKNTIMIVPASCTSIVLGPVPISSVNVPVLNIAFAAAAATASGMSEALETLGKRSITVVVWAGDGGTVDIGLQGLSGAAERNNNFIYICYDNEAYMNTGIQRSGATPKGAWTTTTPKGKKVSKKNLPFIMIEHRIPYVATASIAYPQDFITKLKTAKEIRGLKYIHLHSPCPPGWKFSSNKTIEVARLAVLTGAWILFEVKENVFRLTGPSKELIDKKKRRSVNEYLKIQGRFKQLTDKMIKNIENEIEENWSYIKNILGKKGEYNRKKH